MESECEETEKMSKNKPSVLWAIGLVACISSSGAASGLLFSLSGPTLLYLSENVHATVAQISAMFSGRSAGMFLGVTAYGIAMNRFRRLKPLKVIGMFLMLVGVLSVIIPWLHDLSIFIIVNIIIGLFTGFADAGMQSMYLRLWGEQKSRPFIQTYHFCTGVGGLFAPLLATPFLEMAAGQGTSEDSCPINQTLDTLTTTAKPYITSTQVESTNFNPVSWTYIISGCITFTAALCMLILALFHVEDFVQTSHVETTEQREEEPFKDVFWLLIAVIMFFWMVSGGINVFQSYVYSVAVCGLEFSISDALNLNTIFWAGYSSSTALGVIYIKFFFPSTIISMSLVCASISITLLGIFGAYIPSLLWIVTFLLGFCLSTLFPTGVSWTSRVTNVSKTYILIFGLGNTLGRMTMLPLAGVLFELNTFNVIYLVCALIGFLDAAFLWMTWIERRSASMKQRKALASDISLGSNYNIEKLL